AVLELPDRVRELARPPVVDRLDLAAVRRGERVELLQLGGHRLGREGRVENVDDFVEPHGFPRSVVVTGPAPRQASRGAPARGRSGMVVVPPKGRGEEAIY